VTPRLVFLVAVVATLAGSAHANADAARCPPPPRASPALTARVTAALRARIDVWGERLLRSRAGPTYASVRRLLPPIELARGTKGRLLTATGVHYVPLAQPLGAYGAGSVSLHVADGSEIRAERYDGPRLAVSVRGELYGSCIRRLSRSELADNGLPILETRYRDARGTSYEQESFSARADGAATLTTFVRLQASAPSTARFGVLTATVAPDRPAYVSWGRGRARPRLTDAETYDTARTTLVEYWERRLAEGASFVVPEPVVMAAERALLVQNLSLTWRYSIGNPYEEFSFPESVDGAHVMSEYGFHDVAQSMLRTSLTRRPTPYPNWKMGEKLVGAALEYRLSRDADFVARVTPTLARYVAVLGAQIMRDPNGLLGRERYSSDIPDSVLGLHSQAVVWQGLRASALMWAATGRPGLAQRASTLAARLERGLRKAVRTSERRLPDGSLFVPVRLLDDERPYSSVTESRDGSYWNLVMPYALASGLFAPHSRDATGVFRYMQRHGSRLLGLVRAGAYALYGPHAFPVGGTDQVYGLNVSRFLADNDESGQLVLSLYGQLGAAMTPGTFVAGEASTLSPLAKAYYRATYLPPNSVSNAAFLETLRLILVHETIDTNGAPKGLELAFATPRAWLAPGKRIEVRNVPTSFGLLSYAIEAGTTSAHVSITVPSRSAPRALRLRLRPRGDRRPVSTTAGRLDRRTGTIDLSGRRGTLDFEVRYAS
jgi:hypothetical protein